MNNPTILAHNIRFLRKRMGLNQEQLSEKLNIKRSNIAAYEAKNVEPRLRTILDIAKVFDIELTTFLKVKLTESNLPSFNEDSKPGNKQSENSLSTVSEEELDKFIHKSMKIKKVLLGFKTFYKFKKNKLGTLTPENERIVFDIEIFLELMENLLSHNELIIKAMSTKHQFTSE